MNQISNILKSLQKVAEVQKALNCFKQVTCRSKSAPPTANADKSLYNIRKQESSSFRVTLCRERLSPKIALKILSRELSTKSFQQRWSSLNAGDGKYRTELRKYSKKPKVKKYDGKYIKNNLESVFSHKGYGGTDIDVSGAKMLLSFIVNKQSKFYKEVIDKLPIAKLKTKREVLRKRQNIFPPPNSKHNFLIDSVTTQQNESGNNANTLVEVNKKQREDASANSYHLQLQISNDSQCGTIEKTRSEEKTKISEDRSHIRKHKRQNVAASKEEIKNVEIVEKQFKKSTKSEVDYYIKQLAAKYGKLKTEKPTKPIITYSEYKKRLTYSHKKSIDGIINNISTKHEILPLVANIKNTSLHVSKAKNIETKTERSNPVKRDATNMVNSCKNKTVLKEEQSFKNCNNKYTSKKGTNFQKHMILRKEKPKSNNETLSIKKYGPNDIKTHLRLMNWLKKKSNSGQILNTQNGLLKEKVAANAQNIKSLQKDLDVGIKAPSKSINEITDSISEKTKGNIDSLHLNPKEMGTMNQLLPSSYKKTKETEEKSRIISKQVLEAPNVEKAENRWMPPTYGKKIISKINETEERKNMLIPKEALMTATGIGNLKENKWLPQSINREAKSNRTEDYSCTLMSKEKAHQSDLNKRCIESDLKENQWSQPSISKKIMTIANKYEEKITPLSNEITKLTTIEKWKQPDIKENQLSAQSLSRQNIRKTINENEESKSMLLSKETTNSVSVGKPKQVNVLENQRSPPSLSRQNIRKNINEKESKSIVLSKETTNSVSVGKPKQVIVIENQKLPPSLSRRNIRKTINENEESKSMLLSKETTNSVSVGKPKQLNVIENQRLTRSLSQQNIRNSINEKEESKSMLLSKETTNSVSVGKPKQVNVLENQRSPPSLSRQNIRNNINEKESKSMVLSNETTNSVSVGKSKQVNVIENQRLSQSLSQQNIRNNINEKAESKSMLLSKETTNSVSVGKPKEVNVLENQRSPSSLSRQNIRNNINEKAESKSLLLSKETTNSISVGKPKQLNVIENQRLTRSLSHQNIRNSINEKEESKSMLLSKETTNSVSLGKPKLVNAIENEWLPQTVTNNMEMNKNIISKAQSIQSGYNEISSPYLLSKENSTLPDKETDKMKVQVDIIDIYIEKEKRTKENLLENRKMTNPHVHYQDSENTVKKQTSVKVEKEYNIEYPTGHRIKQNQLPKINSEEPAVDVYNDKEKKLDIIKKNDSTLSIDNSSMLFKIYSPYTETKAEKQNNELDQEKLSISSNGEIINKESGILLEEYKTQLHSKNFGFPFILSLMHDIKDVSLIIHSLKPEVEETIRQLIKDEVYDNLQTGKANPTFNIQNTSLRRLLIMQGFNNIYMLSSLTQLLNNLGSITNTQQIKAIYEIKQKGQINSLYSNFEIDDFYMGLLEFVNDVANKQKSISAYRNMFNFNCFGKMPELKTLSRGGYQISKNSAVPEQITSANAIKEDNYVISSNINVQQKFKEINDQSIKKSEKVSGNVQVGSKIFLTNLETPQTVGRCINELTPESIPKPDECTLTTEIKGGESIRKSLNLYSNCANQDIPSKFIKIKHNEEDYKRLKFVLGLQPAEENLVISSESANEQKIENVNFMCIEAINSIDREFLGNSLPYNYRKTDSPVKFLKQKYEDYIHQLEFVQSLQLIEEKLNITETVADKKVETDNFENECVEINIKTNGLQCNRKENTLEVEETNAYNSIHPMKRNARESVDGYGGSDTEKENCIAKERQNILPVSDFSLSKTVKDKNKRVRSLTEIENIIDEENKDKTDDEIMMCNLQTCGQLIIEQNPNDVSFLEFLDLCLPLKCKRQPGKELSSDEKGNILHSSINSKNMSFYSKYSQNFMPTSEGSEQSKSNSLSNIVSLVNLDPEETNDSELKNDNEVLTFKELYKINKTNDSEKCIEIEIKQAINSEVLNSNPRNKRYDTETYFEDKIYANTALNSRGGDDLNTEVSILRYVNKFKKICPSKSLREKVFGKQPLNQVPLEPPLSVKGYEKSRYINIKNISYKGISEDKKYTDYSDKQKLAIKEPKEITSPEKQSIDLKILEKSGQVTDVHMVQKEKDFKEMTEMRQEKSTDNPDNKKNNFDLDECKSYAKVQVLQQSETLTQKKRNSKELSEMVQEQISDNKPDNKKSSVDVDEYKSNAKMHTLQQSQPSTNTKEINQLKANKSQEFNHIPLKNTNLKVDNKNKHSEKNESLQKNNLKKYDTRSSSAKNSSILEGTTKSVFNETNLSSMTAPNKFFNERSKLSSPGAITNKMETPGFNLTCPPNKVDITQSSLPQFENQQALIEMSTNNNEHTGQTNATNRSQERADNDISLLNTVCNLENRNDKTEKITSVKTKKDKQTQHFWVKPSIPLKSQTDNYTLQKEVNNKKDECILQNKTYSEECVKRMNNENLESAQATSGNNSISKTINPIVLKPSASCKMTWKYKDNTDEVQREKAVNVLKTKLSNNLKPNFDTSKIIKKENILIDTLSRKPDIKNELNWNSISEKQISKYSKKVKHLSGNDDIKNYSGLKQKGPKINTDKLNSAPVPSKGKTNEKRKSDLKSINELDKIVSSYKENFMEQSYGRISISTKDVTKNQQNGVWKYAPLSNKKEEATSTGKVLKNASRFNSFNVDSQIDKNSLYRFYSHTQAESSPKKSKISSTKCNSNNRSIERQKDPEKMVLVKHFSLKPTADKVPNRTRLQKINRIILREKTSPTLPTYPCKSLILRKNISPYKKISKLSDCMETTKIKNAKTFQELFLLHKHQKEEEKLEPVIKLEKKDYDKEEYVCNEEPVTNSQEKHNENKHEQMQESSSKKESQIDSLLLADTKISQSSSVFDNVVNNLQAISSLVSNNKVLNRKYPIKKWQKSINKLQTKIKNSENTDSALYKKNNEKLLFSKMRENENNKKIVEMNERNKKHGTSDVDLEDKVSKSMSFDSIHSKLIPIVNIKKANNNNQAFKHPKRRKRKFQRISEILKEDEQQRKTIEQPQMSYSEVLNMYYNHINSKI